MKKAFGIMVLLILVSTWLLTGCQNENSLSPRNPVTLTVWHNYGGQMKNTMDEMVDEFNATVGAERGIILSVTSISGSATLHEKLTMAAKGDPGAPQLPDMTTAYPKTALILAQEGLLADIGEQFTEEELSAYVPQFLEEGRLINDKLYVFPIAKSTEVLFVNKIIFNRFTKDTGVSFKDLKTFEGIINVAEKYYEWSDNQTPDIKNDGKTFFMIDSLFNFTLVGCEQMSDNFIKYNRLDFTSPAFLRIWNCFYEPAVRGHVAVYDGYRTDLAKTGDVVCNTGSTAGVAFLPSEVTYADNTTEPTDFAILPYPIFEGSKKIAIQRGAGICCTKSTNEKAHAAGIFLKWFTAPEQNIRFLSSTGYLPVTVKAFEDVTAKEIDNISDENIKKLLITAIEMHKEYDFYIPPLFDDYDKLQKEYESKLKNIAIESRDEYQKLLDSEDANTAFQMVSEGAFDDFIN